jgi:uncharacterized membrane protein
MRQGPRGLGAVVERARPHTRLADSDAAVREGGSGFVRREPWLMLLVVAIAVALSVYCILRYDHFGASIDLTLFDQAIWHYSHFQAPFSTIKGFDLLGDHLTPSVALWAPLYWVWADPRLLLAAASALAAASIVPVFLFARDRVGRAAGYGIAVAYAVFWGLQTGIGYEFHEVDLGPAMIALAILLADRRRWGLFAGVIAITLGIKEDLSLFVAAFGVLFLTRRQWRPGAALVVAGVGWYFLATVILIPDLSSLHGFTYWTYTQFGPNLPAAAGYALLHPWRLLTVGLSPSVKTHTLLDLFAPFLFMPLFSRWFILAIPLLGERFLSTRPAFWGTNYHYSLAVAPVLAMSAADGLANVTRALSARVTIRAWMPAAAMALVSLAYGFALYTPLNALTHPSFYTTPSFVVAANRAIAHVPSGAPVTATDAVLPHVSTRSYAQLITAGPVVPDYLIVNLGDPVGRPGGTSTFAREGEIEVADLVHATPVYYFDDWLVAKATSTPTNGVLKPFPRDLARPLFRYAIGWGYLLNRNLAQLLYCHRADSVCWAGARARFLRAQAILLREMATAIDRSSGACASIGAQARAAVREVGDRLADAIELAQKSHPTQLHTILGRLATDVNYQDLPGRPNRYLVLCAPRADNTQ